MKLLIKNLESDSIMFQGEVTTKIEYEFIEAKYPVKKYSREEIK